MATSVYKINKGINMPLEFKGLKAQYIWYMGGVLLLLLILYIILYLCGINQYVCVAVIMVLGVMLGKKIFGMSKRFGQHGLMKVMALKVMPELIKSNSRQLFISLSQS